MTNEEAIKYIENNHCNKCCGCDTLPQDNCPYGKAIEALEKQTPKKVEWTEDYTWGKKTDQPVCPVCDYYLTMHHFIEGSKKVSYCDTCGQAIDWSE
jgi:hypothetical protein